MSRKDIRQVLFARALEIIDAASTAGMPNDDWSVGGSTVPDTDGHARHT